ncbi:ATP-binding protein [Ureibacillus sp. 179-F W5.1 NHS]|uniref:ATP-binding protein n=1 Tax=unclassified Ureibacillus TaxID=2638520 RepID=UPI00311A38E9
MKKTNIKIILVLSALLVLFFTSFSVYTTNVNIRSTVEEAITNQNLETAKTISERFDIETYKKFLKSPQKNNYYWKINNDLNNIREKIGALFVYTIEVDSPKVMKTMVAGLPADKQKSFKIGKLTNVPKKLVKMAYYECKPFTTNMIKDPDYGTYLTVAAPIIDDSNNVLGYVGIDISVEDINEVKTSVLENNIIIFIFNALFIFIMITCFYFIQRWYQKAVVREVEYTEDTYQEEIKTLITSVSSLRHDMTNHLQVIHGLLIIGAVDKAQQYVNSLVNEVQLIKSVSVDSTIEHPGLAILLQTKKLATNNHQINMTTSVDPNPFDRIKSTDMIKILSNLIDNAMDATNELPEELRQITVSCEATDCHYIFEIKNTGPKVPECEEIFKQGFSTKHAEKGKTRGQGLFIVKEVVEKYNGEIALYSTNDYETIARVKIPLK